MSDFKENIDIEIKLWGDFLKAQGRFLNGFGKTFLGWAEFLKVLTSKLMYRQRGRFSQTFIGASMAILSFLTIVFSSQLEDLINNSSNKGEGSTYLIMAADNSWGEYFGFRITKRRNNRISGGRWRYSVIDCSKIWSDD